MTNVYQPLGFVPIRNKFNSGADALNSYTIDPTDTALFGLGDLVRRNTGRIITKAGPTHTPIGVFQGWRYRTRSIFGGSMGGAGNGGTIPYFKVWAGAVVVPTNMEIEAVIDDSPATTYQAQCFATTALTTADIGKLVDMVDCPAGPDISVMGRGKQGVGYPTTYYNIDSYTVSDGGTGYTQNQVDLLVNGIVMDIRPSDITVAAGVITAISLLNKVQGLPGNAPTVTVRAKPGYPNLTDAVISVSGNVSAGQTAAQFRIERILEKPFRVSDAFNNTTGYGLTDVGVFPWVEIAYAKHTRGGSALYA